MRVLDISIAPQAGNRASINMDRPFWEKKKIMKKTFALQQIPMNKALIVQVD